MVISEELSPEEKPRKTQMGTLLDGGLQAGLERTDQAETTSPRSIFSH